MTYLLLKTLHIIFVISWMAALLYLPRLFVYHTEVAASESAAYNRFLWMESRLIKLARIAQVGTLVFGLWLAWAFWGGAVVATYWPLWLWLKTALVVALLVYQEFLIHAYNQFHARQNTLSAKRWRWLNELPAVLMIAIMALVVF